MSSKVFHQRPFLFIYLKVLGSHQVVHRFYPCLYTQRYSGQCLGNYMGYPLPYFQEPFRNMGRTLQEEPKMLRDLEKQSL